MSGFPTDLTADAGGVAGGVDAAEAKEGGEDGFEEMPVVGAAGEEAAKPEVGVFEFVDVDGGEVAVTAGGDIEAQAILGVFGEERGEAVVEEVLDFVFTRAVAGGAEIIEQIDDFVLLEVDAGDFVLDSTFLNDGPFDDGGAGWERVAEVGLFVDFLKAGAGAAVGEEFVFGKGGGAGAVDEIEQAEIEGVGHGHSEIQIPRRGLRMEERGWIHVGGCWMVDARYWGSLLSPTLSSF